MSNLSEKIGYQIGYSVSSLFIAYLKLLKDGIISASKESVKLRYTYIALLVSTGLSFLIVQSCSFFVISILVIGTYNGFRVRKKWKPYKDKVAYFFDIFEKIKLQSYDNELPKFLYEEIISDYTSVFAFKTLVPLSEWENKKEMMEMYFNVKIIALKQDKEDYQNILMYIENEPLPSYIEWQTSYMSFENEDLLLGVSHFGFEGINLNISPHVFVAGESGSGKSVILKCLIHQSILRGYEVSLIDFKRGVSFSCFKGAVDIYFEYDSTIKLLQETVNETNRRLDLFRENNVDSLKDYNKIAVPKMKRRVIFIDELAELLKTRDKEISNALYDSIETLTRISRACGIHLIMGVQRPDSKVITGQIKSNVATRLTGRLTDVEHSRIIIGSSDATKIPIDIKGRCIVKNAEIRLFQAFYYDNTFADMFAGFNQEQEIVEIATKEQEVTQIAMEEQEVKQISQEEQEEEQPTIIKLNFKQKQVFFRLLIKGETKRQRQLEYLRFYRECIGEDKLRLPIAFGNAKLQKTQDSVKTEKVPKENQNTELPINKIENLNFDFSDVRNKFLEK